MKSMTLGSSGWWDILVDNFYFVFYVFFRFPTISIYDNYIQRECHLQINTQIYAIIYKMITNKKGLFIAVIPSEINQDNIWHKYKCQGCFFLPVFILMSLAFSENILIFISWLLKNMTIYDTKSVNNN